MTSYQSIWVRLSRVWGGPGSVDVSVKIASSASTARYVLTRALDTLVNVPEKAHKNLAYSIHPIGKIKSMNRVMTSFSCTAGTT